MHRVGLVCVWKGGEASGGGDLHKNDGAHDNDPSEGAHGTRAGLADEGRDDEVDGGDPEEDLDGVDDGVGLEGLPPLESPDVFGEELVGDETERLGTLCICDVPVRFQSSGAFRARVVGGARQLTKARPILPLPENGTPMVTLTMVRMMMGRMNTTSTM